MIAKPEEPLERILLVSAVGPEVQPAIEEILALEIRFELFATYRPLSGNQVVLLLRVGVAEEAHSRVHAETVIVPDVGRDDAAHALLFIRNQYDREEAYRRPLVGIDDDFRHGDDCGLSGDRTARGQNCRRAERAQRKPHLVRDPHLTQHQTTVRSAGKADGVRHLCGGSARKQP